MARRVVILTLWFALSCGGSPAPAPIMPPAAPTPTPEVAEAEPEPEPEPEPQLVAQAAKVEPPEAGPLRFLGTGPARDAEGPETKPAKGANPFIADSKTGMTRNMCKGGRCPSGYRCGSVPGRPRKVCIATGQHRAGPRNMFERTVP